MCTNDNVIHHVMERWNVYVRTVRKAERVHYAYITAEKLHNSCTDSTIREKGQRIIFTTLINSQYQMSRDILLMFKPHRHSFVVSYTPLKITACPFFFSLGFLDSIHRPLISTHVNFFLSFTECYELWLKCRKLHTEVLGLSVWDLCSCTLYLTTLMFEF